MRGRRPTALDVEAPPPPVVVVEKRPTYEAECFKPSSFASRKAEADARREALAEPRLVSLGPTEFAQRDRRTNEVEYIPAELYMDVDRPMHRYIRLDGRPGMHALHDETSGKQDRATPVPGTFRLHGRGPSALTQRSENPDSRRPV
jgi:hypothetical protein